MVSGRVANGNITGYVHGNADNHLKLVGYNRVTDCYHLPRPQSLGIVEV